MGGKWNGESTDETGDGGDGGVVAGTAVEGDQCNFDGKDANADQEEEAKPKAEAEEAKGEVKT
jgi:hypothetical protein